MMKNISTIDERILQIIDIQCNGNKKKFSDMIGYAPQVISNIVSGRKTNPSFEVINAILSTFDDFSAEWLVLGKGEMLKIQGVNQPEVLSLTENNIYLLELLKKNLKEKELQLDDCKNEVESLKKYKGASHGG